MHSLYSLILQVSSGLLVASCLTVYQGIRSAEEEYRAERTATAFDLLLEFDWRGSLSVDETASHFLAIAIISGTCWCDPKNFPNYLDKILKDLDFCEEEAIPAMVATCECVATTVLSRVPEAELGREEKENTMLIVNHIFELGLQKINSIRNSKWLSLLPEEIRMLTHMKELMENLMQEKLKEMADLEKKIEKLKKLVDVEDLEKRLTNLYSQIG